MDNPLGVRIECDGEEQLSFVKTNTDALTGILKDLYSVLSGKGAGRTVCTLDWKW